MIGILKWITLEPAIFLIVCGQHLVKGSNLQVDLLIWKICHLELNYPEDVCANITNDERMMRTEGDKIRQASKQKLQDWC